MTSMKQLRPPWLSRRLLRDVPDVSGPVLHARNGVPPPVIRGYDILEHLDTARFASTCLVVQTRDQAAEGRHNNEFMAKVYANEYPEGDFVKELHFLRIVQRHPNVMTLCAFQEQETRVIVVPMYESNLRDYLGKQNQLVESIAALLMLGLLKAVRYVHSRGVIHRNIEPGSVAVKDSPSIAAILIDFSYACHTWDNFATQDSFGIVGYVAPEVPLRLGSTIMSDIFSAGCVFYYVIQRRSPFETDPFDERASLRLNVLCEYEFGEQFESISSDCEALITSMLMRTPASRSSADRLLEHTWFLKA